ncbi:MAG: DUF2750 domain-containing protein [Hyphomicrobium sp.]
MSSSTPNAAALHRDRFLERIVAANRVFAVSGEDGLARLPSRWLKGREVTLLWSDRGEAERWSPLIARNPRIKELRLSELLGEVLPVLTRIRRLVGVDWQREGIEPETDPSDLVERIRLASLDAFVRKVVRSGRVWTLADAAGPAMLVSQTRPELLVLPCWADRNEAEARIEGPWEDMMAIETPLAEFVWSNLTLLGGQGQLVSPGHIGGAAILELSPDDLAERLTAGVRKGEASSGSAAG